MRNAGMGEAQAWIYIAGTNISNIRYADNTTLMAESAEELKSLLMKAETEEWKSWFKTQHSENKNCGIWSYHFMANRWGNNGNSGRLFSWAPKSLQMVICSHEIKRHFFLGREAMTDLDSISKSRDITLLTKVCLVKAMVFPVVMCRYES